MFFQIYCKINLAQKYTRIKWDTFAFSFKKADFFKKEDNFIQHEKYNMKTHTTCLYNTHTTRNSYITKNTKKGAFRGILLFLEMRWNKEPQKLEIRNPLSGICIYWYILPCEKNQLILMHASMGAMLLQSVYRGATKVLP